jgi:hypothetical protein
MKDKSAVSYQCGVLHGPPSLLRLPSWLRFALLFIELAFFSHSRQGRERTNQCGVPHALQHFVHPLLPWLSSQPVYIRFLIRKWGRENTRSGLQCDVPHELQSLHLEQEWSREHHPHLPQFPLRSGRSGQPCSLWPSSPQSIKISH